MDLCYFSFFWRGKYYCIFHGDFKCVTKGDVHSMLTGVVHNTISQDAAPWEGLHTGWRGIFSSCFRRAVHITLRGATCSSLIGVAHSCLRKALCSTQHLWDCGFTETKGQSQTGILYAYSPVSVEVSKARGRKVSLRFTVLVIHITLYSKTSRNFCYQSCLH